ncbi:hypothetical protein CPB84DRAFT_1858486 [Gymnopilus junonius]|uniref:Uncharacterized protein n=1 Tax=Gymnopilus junonius TaxID=109634 RepID=A0A9P5TF78_GYMJU|nr:hypothetical protein CPB84DRAFT_1858486 [Gymnopilus junonius]
MGQPALSELYHKTSDKTGNPYIFINATVHSDLSWLATIIPQSISIHFVDQGLWSDADADVTIYTDAALNDRIAYTFENKGYAYQHTPQQNSPKVNIFFLELITIILDSVGVFNCLAADESMHNAVLLRVANIML